MSMTCFGGHLFWITVIRVDHLVVCFDHLAGSEFRVEEVARPTVKRFLFGNREN